MFGKINNKRIFRKNGVYVKCKKHHLGVTEKKRDEEVIVSLTSHPGRILYVHMTIITLLNQTIKPDHIILWLANEQFPKKELDLPKELLELRDNGLEIMWCEDIRSYKKLIPTLILFPDAIIITVDDDWYYKDTLVEHLLNEYRQTPNCIISEQITHPHFDEEGLLVSETDMQKYKGTSSYFNKMLGCGGVLYKKRLLDDGVIEKEQFMKLAQTNNDIWFWAMALKKRTKIKYPKNPVWPYAMTNPIIQSKTSLAMINNAGNLYEKTTSIIFAEYPEVKEILLGISK